MQTQTKPQQKQQTPKITGIYRIATPFGNYVGQSTSILDRAHEHLYGREKGKGLVDGHHHNYKLQGAWERDGGAGKGFTLYLIQECDRKNLNALEAYWIDKLGDFNIERPKVKLPWGVRPHNENRRLLQFSELVKPSDRIPKQKPKRSNIFSQLIKLIIAGLIGALIIKSLLLPWQWGFWAGAIGCYLNSMLNRK